MMNFAEKTFFFFSFSSTHFDWNQTFWFDRQIRCIPIELQANLMRKWDYCSAMGVVKNFIFHRKFQLEFLYNRFDVSAFNFSFSTFFITSCRWFCTNLSNLRNEWTQKLFAAFHFRWADSFLHFTWALSYILRLLKWKCFSEIRSVPSWECFTFLFPLNSAP